MANELEVNDSNPGGPEAKKQQGLSQALWVFFSEMKTAIVLLLLLAVVSILGTVITQGASPEEYVARYGAKIYAFIKYLGLNDAYNSGIFKTLLMLVGINLTVCSINRFDTTWKRTFPRMQAFSEEAIAKMPRYEQLPVAGSVDDAASRMEATLHQRKYSVFRIGEAEGVSLYASKGRATLWGPFLTHLSLLVIFIGSIYGNISGFNGFTTIPEGESVTTFYRDSTQSEEQLGFRVALTKFDIGHDLRGNPTSYKSDLVIYEGDKQVIRKVIDVNHPLTYKGVSFFQSDYGLSGLVVKITDPKGTSTTLHYELATQSGPYGKEYQVSGEPFKTVKLDGKNITVFVHEFNPDYTEGTEEQMSSLPINPAVKVMVNDRFPQYKGLDAWTKLGWLEVGKKANYKGYTVQVSDVIDYTGLQVSKNPGLPMVYLGFSLLMLGVFLSFYVLHRTIRIKFSHNQQGAVVHMGATSRGEPKVFDADFQRLRNALKEV